MDIEHGPLITEVMTRSVHTVEADTAFEEAEDVMKRHSIHHLPVMRSGTIVGLISDQNIRTVSALYGRLGPRTKITAGDIATHDVYVAAPDTPLEEITAQLVKRHVSAAVIADGGKVQGIFTLSDACRWMARLFEEA